MTIEQRAANDVEGLDEMDDFDLLEATIDPSDLKSLSRRAELLRELESERMKERTKLAWKRAFSAENPMRIDE